MKKKLPKRILKEIIEYEQQRHEAFSYTEDKTGLLKKVLGPFYTIIRTKHALSDSQKRKIFRFMDYSTEEGNNFVLFQVAWKDFIPKDAQLKSIELAFQK